MGKHLHFSALCLLLAQPGTAGGTLRGLLIIKSHLFFKELFLLLGEIVVPEELVVPRSLFAQKLDLLPQFVYFQLHALAIIVVIEGMALLVIVLAGQQP